MSNNCAKVLPCPYYRNRFVNWDDYVKPLMDTALSDSLLDFMDFHAYDEDANPGVCY